jgi:uncharacterized protein
MCYIKTREPYFNLGRDIMKRFFIFVIMVLMSMGTAQGALALEVGEVPPKVELKDKLGGRLDGKPWSSDELQGKVHVIFYVDPDEKDTNNPASEALNKENFPTDKLQSFGIINMAATWKPNYFISSALEEKQKQYPKTIYVKDYKKVLVQAWKIADDSSDVLAFDKKGKVIFKKDGKLSAEDIQKLIKVIRDNL